MSTTDKNDKGIYNMKCTSDKENKGAGLLPFKETLLFHLKKHLKKHKETATLIPFNTCIGLLHMHLQ